MGKAILKKPKVLLVDEKALEIGDKFDSFLFELVMRNFKKATVLMNLNKFQYLDSFDKVAVIHSGKVLEKGRPGELLAKSDSFLERLIVQRGDAGLLNLVNTQMQKKGKLG